MTAHEPQIRLTRKIIYLIAAETDLDHRTVKGDPTHALEVLQERADVVRTTCDGRVIRSEFTGAADDVDDLLVYLMQRDVRLLGFTRSQADLEDIFLKITRGTVA